MQCDKICPMSKYTPFEISITAIICKDSKYLITKRSLTKPRFPGKWTVTGGHLGPEDYENFPKDTEECWYNVLEKALAREVKEEVGLEVENVRYLTSLIIDIPIEETVPLVISCLADYKNGEVKLEEGEADEFAWITTKEAKKYDLIGGILDELIMADKLRKGEKTQWQQLFTHTNQQM